ncbi:glucosamine-6-phosphate deaminase [Fusibacter bizertensis]|uniref:Glucosamine-6-phosphate deaminase n=1 Tax=Fusibacter bizertensis TaxID=1488331 RepID=A0ABT6NE84_9FIRM|nr:glucosamine-6-phosphate deaminase [Fusibacter bizertensis]MDH8678711.1 glucosamine-6-phosphate deaminase [Fusibacter bizertensis]
MNIIIVKDYEEMSRKAAHLFVAQILNKPNSVLGLATGSTPMGLYKELIRFFNEGMISFQSATAFNLDEYVGLEKEHPQSYWRFMQENFFTKVDLPVERQFIPSGVAEDIAAESYNYDKNITSKGGIDLQVLGIGRNGHIGFNEPDLKFEARTHVVKLDEQTIEDNARFFDDISMVPTLAISMGVKTIMQSRSIILLASGKEKGEAIKKMLSGNITPELPASVLQLHPSVTAIIDLAAASMLDIEALKDLYQISMPS